MEFLTWLTDRLWNPWLLGLFLLTGAYFTLRTGFFQLLPHRWLPPLARRLLHRNPAAPTSGLTQFQALSTALASTIGTGSIAGVATAIFFGGPGAVFWMWLSAFLGMMTSAAEKAVAVGRREEGEGVPRGGPMIYMREIPKIGGFLALFFSISCFWASLVGGGMVQANSIATALRAAFGAEPWVVGGVTAGVVGWVLLGGVKRIGAVSEQVVPIMAIGFLLAGGAVIFVHRAALPNAFRMILEGAFCPQAALGGYSAASALRYGVARGVFTNEAGLGSSAMAHAAATDTTPAEEGLWGMFEVLVATLLICSVTALAILTSGVYDPAAALEMLAQGHVDPASLGAPLSAAAFATVFPRAGAGFVAVSLLLFAFTSLLGWGYYGQRALESLLPGRKTALPFRLLFLGSILLGSVTDVAEVWVLSDLANGLMALPNLTALLLLSPKALELLGFSKKGANRT